MYVNCLARPRTHIRSEISRAAGFNVQKLLSLFSSSHGGDVVGIRAAQRMEGQVTGRLERSSTAGAASGARCAEVMRRTDLAGAARRPPATTWEEARSRCRGGGGRGGDDGTSRARHMDACAARRGDDRVERSARPGRDELAASPRSAAAETAADRSASQRRRRRGRRWRRRLRGSR